MDIFAKAIPLLSAPEFRAAEIVDSKPVVESGDGDLDLEFDPIAANSDQTSLLLSLGPEVVHPDGGLVLLAATASDGRPMAVRLLDDGSIDELFSVSLHIDWLGGIHPELTSHRGDGFVISGEFQFQNDCPSISLLIRQGLDGKWDRSFAKWKDSQRNHSLGSGWALGPKF